jgi:poly[(R)-3-hydroxyalkanoate] polymerase subunit PhaC
LPLWKSGSLPWSEDLSGRAAGLAQELKQSQNDAGAEAFNRAVERELWHRGDLFLKGIERYRRHPYRRSPQEMPVLWQEGTTRLLDYAPAGGDPVLVVPSLINRFYILDLAAGNSLLRWLGMQGLRPLVVDWDAPGEAERGFGLDQYIAGRLERAAEAATEASGGKPLPVLGYCMGGLLALALAARRPELVSRLALLATPWSFHAERPDHARLLGALGRRFAVAFAGFGEVPLDLLQALFASLDPLLVVRKFIRFAQLPEDSAAALAFVAMEDWLNDGVALALPAAVDCLVGWYGENLPGKGAWKVAGRAVVPEEIACPSLVLLPAQDRIVPPLSARALAAALPNATVLAPALGHIGMVVGHEAPKEVWGTLREWGKLR